MLKEIKESSLRSFRDKNGVIELTKEEIKVGGPYRMLYHNSLASDERDELRTNFSEIMDLW